MELSEGKLFTIEALNRIEGFEWPEWANYASMCCDGGYHWFWSDKPINSGEMFSAAGMVNAVLIGSNHPDWKNSLITRAEFESVDGWVRNDGKSIHEISGKAVIEYIKRNDSVYWEQAEFVGLTHTGSNGDIMKWRYCKKQNQVEQPIPQPDAGIETLISQHKAAKQSTLEARRLLEQAEAAEHNLLLSIEAWAESNGFDIRILDKVQEKPELVVTDWRDLRVGDVIWWSGDSNHDAGEYPVVRVEAFECANSMPILLEIHADMREWVNVDEEQWKFVSRPAKGGK